MYLCVCVRLGGSNLIKCFTARSRPTAPLSALASNDRTGVVPYPTSTVNLRSLPSWPNRYSICNQGLSMVFGAGVRIRVAYSLAEAQNMTADG